eukprot:TRINITY_DN9926_c0_g1_i1.p1 TRINITY_DN9926_c0_g1~~TRINITY_DN9926_c0_g1_i1.p1  ORF type:complete len:408 (-),score=88.90 TRINITY_DN9926_c0_g1_i1:66-1112(-)
MLPDQEIPVVLDMTIAHLEVRQIEAEMLLDSKTDSPSVLRLKHKLEKGQLYISLDEDVNVLCGLLKLYLIHLPGPIIPTQHFKLIVETINKKFKSKKKDTSKSISAIKELMERLSPLPRICAHRCVTFLYNVSQNWWNNSEDESSELVQWFAPYILRPCDKIENIPQKDKQALINAANILIQFQFEIFGAKIENKPYYFKSSYGPREDIHKLNLIDNTELAKPQPAKPSVQDDQRNSNKVTDDSGLKPKARNPRKKVSHLSDNPRRKSSSRRQEKLHDHSLDPSSLESIPDDHYIRADEVKKYVKSISDQIDDLKKELEISKKKTSKKESRKTSSKRPEKPNPSSDSR